MDVRTRRFNVTEYYDMWRRGYFEGQRVQLINGAIVEMAPQNDPHSLSVMLARTVLTRAFGLDDYAIFSQQPLALDPANHPEPDVFVVEGSAQEVASRAGHPTSALLVVEVAHSSLAFDRRQKAPMYARAGITEYWIVNLVDRTLEVRRSPVGKTYNGRKVYKAADSVTSPAMKSRKIKVADLLPEARAA
jgi:Uma2 family endonuclease